MARTRTVTFSYNPHYTAPQPSEAPEQVPDAKSLMSTPATDYAVGSATQYSVEHASTLIKTLESYTTVSVEQDAQWFATSVEIVEIMRDWRKAYKQLEQRKRALKKQQKKDKAAATPHSSPLSSQHHTEETPSTAETSANDNDKSESESDRRPVKRRRMGL